MGRSRKAKNRWLPKRFAKFITSAGWGCGGPKKEGLIAVNPTHDADLPRYDKKPVRALNAEQLDTYQQAALGTWVDLFLRITAANGARRGEILALKWSDINWELSTLRIERSLYYALGKLGHQSY